MRDYHVAGRKRDYDWRLEGPERAGRAGIRRLGVGALLGLHDPWREEAIATAAHARFLTRRFWRSEITVSVPRIRPSASGYVPRADVSDRELAQTICALRLFLPDAGIVMSSREAAGFRDALVPLGVTHTSAGSHTEPGGYTEPGEAEGQFEVNDTRTPEAGRRRAVGSRVRRRLEGLGPGAPRLDAVLDRRRQRKAAGAPRRLDDPSTSSTASAGSPSGSSSSTTVSRSSEARSADVGLAEGDRLEIVRAVAGGAPR